MPDVIYAKICSVYDLCCPAGDLNTWDDTDNKDGSFKYHSDTKYQALDARITELEAAINAVHALHLESAKPFDDAGMILLGVMKK